MSYDSDWLNLLKELAETASLITISIPISSLVNSGDDDFFLYWFMDRTLKIERSCAAECIEVLNTRNSIMYSGEALPYLL